MLYFFFDSVTVSRRCYTLSFDSVTVSKRCYTFSFDSVTVSKKCLVVANIPSNSAFPDNQRVALWSNGSVSEACCNFLAV